MVFKMARGNRLVAHVFTLLTPSCSVDVTESSDLITRLCISSLSSSVTVFSSVNFLITLSRPDWNALRKKPLSAAWKNEIIDANPKMSARDPVIWRTCRTYLDCDVTSTFRCLKKVVIVSSRIMSYSYFDWIRIIFSSRTRVRSTSSFQSFWLQKESLEFSSEGMIPSFNLSSDARRDSLTSL